MSNQWFRFKQFTVKQDRCAMKVGTDGVILGAWTPLAGAEKALDVGTGTGLMALMLAQRSEKLRITAIELDDAAAGQARENVMDSPFNDRIEVLKADFREYMKNREAFDLLLCNPPYFRGSMKPGNQARSRARHDEELSFEELFIGAKNLLTGQGSLSLIFPADARELVAQSAHNNAFFLHRELAIRPVPGKAVSRYVQSYGRQEKEASREEMLIESHGRHQYSKEYLVLTSEFYL